MTAKRDEEESLDEAYEVLDWRIGELVNAGYPEKLAVIIALHTEIDLHRACELVKRGCPPKKAYRILR